MLLTKSVDWLSAWAHVAIELQAQDHSHFYEINEKTTISIIASITIEFNLFFLPVDFLNEFQRFEAGQESG